MAEPGMINARRHDMSKQKNTRQFSELPPEQVTSTPPPVVSSPAPVDSPPEVVVNATEPVKTLAGHDLKPHRRCPLCWNRAQGYGTAYSTAPNGRSYYKCNQTLTEQMPCGHTWSVVASLQTIVVQHREVNIEGQR